MTNTLIGLGMVAALAACGKSAKECRIEAEALGALFAEANTEPSIFLIPDDMKLVSRRDLSKPRVAFAPIVNLTATQITFRGEPTDREELRDRLAAEHARIEEDLQLGRVPRSNPPNPEHVYLLIDEATPWRRVVETVHTAAEVGMRAPAFVFAVPVTTKPPPRAPIDDKLDAIIANEDAGNKATEFARIIEKQVEDCPALQKVFRSVASEEGKDKAQVLIEGIPPALIACECKVHVGNFRSAMYRLLANPRPTRVIAFDPAAAKTTIALPAATPWREASKSFSADLKFAELVAN